MQVENINKQDCNWSVEVDGNSIKIENNSSITKLFVNEKLQDVLPGIATSARLNGKLPDGREIKVVFGGMFKVHCYIFVDNELVLED